MKNRNNILLEWGKALKNNALQDIIELAIAENSWFSNNDILLAITAITNEMLQNDKLSQWLSHYKDGAKCSNRENILIVMAGNIPLVGLFDLLCVIATGHTALVKPSHKDRILMEWAISELKRIDPTTPIYIYDDTSRIDRLIATGNEITRRHFESRYPNIPTIIRGTRHSLAVVSTTDNDIELLEQDIFSYSGLGCRNVSMIFLPTDFDPNTLPRGEVNPKHRNNYLRIKALLTMNGVEFTDTQTHCLVESREFSSEISQLSIFRYDTISQVEEWIEQHDSEIQCIVANRNTLHHPRRVDFGRAQHPTLFDYADGVDTMKFLLNE